jgi:1-deoxy-D-xylulose-5-phosphate reductoisomerase
MSSTYPNPSFHRRVAVLGSTGSIGVNCLDVIRSLSDLLQALALSANSNWQQLLTQVEEFKPRMVAVTDADAASALRPMLPAGTELLFGQDGIAKMVSQPDVDIVVVAIVGAAGLFGTWAALEAGKTVAVANKETLVMAGPLVTEMAARHGATILPVDSEHSAVFQCLQASSSPPYEGGVGGVAASNDNASSRREPPPLPFRKGGSNSEVARIVLTGSGGPFRGKRRQELESVTVEQALKHPTWRMGPKITIDSATLMNKALEIIEARWLFGLTPEQIGLIIHPESIVHSFVEFKDGSVLAQLSPPDMRLPIQYALTYPERLPGPTRRLDWAALRSLNFEQPDPETFLAVQLGYEVAGRGGTSGAVLNAANEAAVGRFLAGTLRFLEIPQVCREVLDAHTFDPLPSLQELVGLDTWARQEVDRWKTG